MLKSTITKRDEFMKERDDLIKERESLEKERDGLRQKLATYEPPVPLKKAPWHAGVRGKPCPK